MTNAKRILITTESREIFIVQMSASNGTRGYCPQCMREAALLTLDEAVNFSTRNALELIRHTETGAVHATETATGHLLICRNSLEAMFAGERK